MSKSYSIGEVATMTKLSIPTIRYYDKEGLIPELKKTLLVPVVLMTRILALSK